MEKVEAKPVAVPEAEVAPAVEAVPASPEPAVVPVSAKPEVVPVPVKAVEAEKVVEKPAEVVAPAVAIQPVRSPVVEGISQGPILLEIAWEVARKVGGIYTVIRTKVPFTSGLWGDRFGLVGIYNAESAAAEFEPVTPAPITAAIIESLKRKHHGLRVHFGRWLIPGYPHVFLFDLYSVEHNVYQWRQDLMPGFARPDDRETNEAIIFGNMVCWLLEEFVEMGKEVVAHFHEWQAAVGLILARQRNLKVSTIFTTHATLLGRYLCAARKDLYNILTQIHVDREAGERGIYHRHWIEREAAQLSHVFSTVSEITAFEAEHILDRKVDVIVPNGLNVQRFAALHTFQNLHAENKALINDFIRGHFYGFYDFDLDKTLYFFTAGRREYFNKGVDVFLDGLAQLNDILKREGSDVTVIAFIIMPGETNNYNVESLKGQSVIRDLHDTCDKVMAKMGKQLMEMALKGQMVDSLKFSKEDEVLLKRRIQAVKRRESLPPIVTHNMVSDQDEILQHLRRIQMFNRPEDRVKIIYHPEFLNPTSTLLPMDYSDFVRGCHLGVFPSYYEPWGYTPAECTLLGVPSVTSNLTGFSNFMTRRVPEPESHGIFVCDRRFRSYDETVTQMTNIMWRFCALNRRERIELRNKTEKLSSLLNWTSLGKSYINAYRLAYKEQFDKSIDGFINENYQEEESWI